MKYFVLGTLIFAFIVGFLALLSINSLIFTLVFPVLFGAGVVSMIATSIWAIASGWLYGTYATRWLIGVYTDYLETVR